MLIVASAAESACGQRPQAPTIAHMRGVSSCSRGLAWRHYAHNEQRSRQAARPMVPPAPAALPPRAAAAAAAAAAAGPAPLPPAVANYLEAFSQRSPECMAACLAFDVQYHSFSMPEPYSGRQAVLGLLSSLVRGAPPEWQLVVEDVVADPAGAAAAVVFCMRDGAGRVVPLSHGVAFYRLDEAGLISSITEASEQVLKFPQAALPAVSAAAPLLHALGSGPLGGLLDAVAQASQPLHPAAATSRLGSSSAKSSIPGGPSRPRSSIPGALSRPPGMPGSSTGDSGSTGGRLSSAASPPTAPATAASSGTGPVPVAHAAGSSSPGSSGSSSRGGSSSSSSIGPIAGVWIKDAAASDVDSYSRACDLLQLSGLQKMTAMQLIEGVEIQQEGEQVAVRFLTVVPFFKVSEVAHLGHPTTMSRRDLRQGSQQAQASVAPDGSLRVSITWGEPNAGSVEEVYRVMGGATGDEALLECLSTVRVAAGSVTTRTIYRHSAGGWQPRNKWNPLYMLTQGRS